MKIYFRIQRIVGALALLAWLTHSPAANAAQQLVLVADQTQIVKLPESPSTVVVGNPSVADVTTEGNLLLFHPRGFGLTNVIALDNRGRKLADYQVRVVFEDTYSVSMYGPGGRQTYSCRKDCEPMMRIGDDAGFSGGYSAQVTEKNSLAQRQVWGEDLLARPTSGVQTVVTGGGIP